MLNRRDFLLRSAAATGLLAAAPSTAMPRVRRSRLDRIGVALFTLPALLDRDYEGTMRMLAAIGYREVQLFGPFPFSAPEAHERWKTLSAQLGLQRTGFYGRTARQVREILDRNRLSATLMHVDLATLRTRLDQAADAANTLGMPYLGITALPAAARPNLDGDRRAADEMNAIGARLARHGLRFSYHNHGYGLTEREGRVPLQVVIERTDPALVDLLMDIFWMVVGGGDPVAYLDAYPGRYRLMHVKDMTQKVRFKGDGGDSDQWTAMFPYMTEAGSGVLDLKTILSRARRSGVRHFLIEQDLVANPRASLAKSYRYLAALELDD
jgi:sugar phosphate isomerase/epimerase